MKAFHGSEEVKAKYVARLAAHHAADEIIQGTGYNGSHGCAVGCTLNDYDHQAYETELGLPQWLAHLEDRIFEGLPPKFAQQFAVDFLAAIPVGADVSKVRWQLAIQRHTRDRDRFASNKEPYALECVAAVNQVIAYCSLEEKTESAARSAAVVAESAAVVAESAAAAAARSAARSAESVARSAAAAARSAARSARSAARSAESVESVAASASAAAAAWSAAAAAWSAAAAVLATESAWSATESAWSDHFQWEAQTLLALLAAAPQAE